MPCNQIIYDKKHEPAGPLYISEEEITITLILLHSSTCPLLQLVSITKRHAMAIEMGFLMCLWVCV